MEKLEELKVEIEKEGVRVLPIKCDVINTNIDYFKKSKGEIIWIYIIYI